MPASDTSTQRNQALALLKRRGMTRLAELHEAGITATTVSRMERSGEVVRLARGLYQLPNAALDSQQSLAEAARPVPKGVICLASALAFHGLTDQMPPKVWIAIGRKDWRPRLNYPPIRIARFPDELLRRSVERKKIAGTPVLVFGVAKRWPTCSATVEQWAMRLSSKACAKRCGASRPRLPRLREKPRPRECGPRWSPTSWR